MVIKANKGPLHGLAVMQQALEARATRAAVFSTPLGGAPQSGSPVPVYHLPLINLGDDDPLAAASVTSWRYPIIGGIEPGLADIRQSDDDSSASYGGLSQGLLARRFIQASLLAEQALAAAPEELQPRLLDVPALQFAALWLHGDLSNYFVSLFDGRPAGTAPLRLVTEVVPDLRARAARRLPPTGFATPPLGGGQSGTPTN